MLETLIKDLNTAVPQGRAISLEVLVEAHIAPDRKNVYKNQSQNKGQEKRSPWFYYRFDHVLQGGVAVYHVQQVPGEEEGMHSDAQNREEKV